MSSAGAMNGLTVFGARTSINESAVTASLVQLYGEPKPYTDKELKKLEKIRKFREKQAAKSSGGDKKSKGAKADKSGDKKTSDKSASKGTKSKDIPYVAPPPGEKKDLGRPLPAAYNPTEVEDAWYSWWMKQGFFKPEYSDAKDGSKKDPFTIVIPPPNVTGTLHLGHALTNAIEDSVVRWRRMSGYRTLYNPGIATQTVVEKKLAREEKLSRHDIGREKFIERVWEWKDKSGARIYEQLRLIGASLDWDREAFTMSPRCVTAVEAAFIQMHKDGLIYRSNRLINWSCELQSAISDIEVDKVELSGKTLMKVPGYANRVEVGVITSFAYKIDGTDDEIVVATTRLETMLGDTAIAVHPKDERYRKYVGKQVSHPFIADRKLVIVADEMVDMNFGTGAVKITPAHDHKDYECGKRNDLPFITIFTKTGHVEAGCGQFSGMKRFDARVAVEQALTELGLFRGKADNPMVVPVCSRSKDIIEPLSVPQWFCHCTEMAADAAAAVRSGELKITPDVHVKKWYHWLDNTEEWCISRQLWWGHRIPAYFVTLTDGSAPGDDSDNKYWVSAPSEEEALAEAVQRFGVSADKIRLRQDEDVLDTWFSSGIFPISIFGWPNVDTDEFNNFYPGHLLETGHDILFFWVARMVMMCKYLTGKLPFTEVYMHSLVRDAHGRKMSKSLGNVIDPVAVCTGVTLAELQKSLEGGNLDPKEVKKAQAGQAIDFKDGIPQCGADALRFALCAFVSNSGRDINLDVARVYGYRTFCNKMWNAVKFAMMALGDDFKPQKADVALSGLESPADRWILSRLSATAKIANDGFTTYEFSAVTTAIHSYWLYDLCGTYIEWVKPVVFTDGTSPQKEASQQVLYTCVEQGLRLISPFMPFVTEELWQRLPQRPGDSIASICVATYPKDVPGHDESLEKLIAVVQNVIGAVRSMKDTYNLPPKVRPTVHLKAADSAVAELLVSLQTEVGQLSKAEVDILGAQQDAPLGCAVDVADGVEVHLMIKGLVDVATEVAKLEKTTASLKAKIDKATALLASDGAAKMKPEALADKQDKLENDRLELATVEKAIDMYKTL